MTDVQRQGRFTDSDPGGGLVQGYRDAISQDPFNKKFLARNYAQYKTLKGAGLGKVGGLKKLKGLNDTQLEAIATKAVLQDHGYKPKKLPTKMNRQRYNVEWAKKVMARQAAGQTVRKQTLQSTREARAYIKRIQRNRQVMGTPLWEGVPKAFR